MKLRRTIPVAAPGGADFAAVGEISLDTFARGSRLGDSSKQSVHEVVDLPGGQAATAAVACARLGWRSRWIGAVGDDEPGRRGLSALASEAVAAVAVTRNNVMSRRAVILVDGATGDRRVFQRRDERLNISPGELLEATYTTTRILLVDASDPAHSMHAAAIARAVGVLTIVDVDFVWPGLHDLLRLIDVIVMPGPTVQAAAGQGGVGSALGEIGRRSGALTVVATLGAEGALAWSDGEEVRIPGRREHVVDTTGAGDAFRAGFAAGLLGRAGTRPDLGDLLADANLVAALACRELGAQTALPKGLEVPAHLRGPV